MLTLEAYIRSAMVKAIRACCPEGAIPSSLVISQIKFIGQDFSVCSLPMQGSQGVRAGWAVPAFLELAEFVCACWATGWVSTWFWCKSRQFEIRAYKINIFLCGNRQQILLWLNLDFLGEYAQQGTQKIHGIHRSQMLSHELHGCVEGDHWDP